MSKITGPPNCVFDGQPPPETDGHCEPYHTRMKVIDALSRPNRRRLLCEDASQPRTNAQTQGMLMIDWITQEFGAPTQASALVAVFSALVAVVSAAFTLINARTARLNVRDQMLRYSIDLAERTRTERAVLRDWNPIAGAPMPERIREACDKVARTFDIIAFLDRTRTIDRQFVDSFYSGAFIDLWDKALRSYVIEMQAQRSPRHFWELKRFYDRVRYVNDWHPANTNRKNWPKNPRKFHWRRYITQDRSKISL